MDIVHLSITLWTPTPINRRRVLCSISHAKRWRWSAIRLLSLAVSESFLEYWASLIWQFFRSVFLQVFASSVRWPLPAAYSVQSAMASLITPTNKISRRNSCSNVLTFSLLLQSCCPSSSRLTFGLSWKTSNRPFSPPSGSPRSLRSAFTLNYVPWWDNANELGHPAIPGDFHLLLSGDWSSVHCCRVF